MPHIPPVTEASACDSGSQLRRCWLYNQQRVPYQVAWEWQRSLVLSRINNPSLDDVLILLEHPPVYTLGQGASLDFLKFDPTQIKAEAFPQIIAGGDTKEIYDNASPLPDVYRVERGGEVTYHCPGQLVGYPILNLRHYRQDLHWYLRQLEEVLIRLLAVYGLKGSRIPGFTGVWLEGRKVAAIGIKVSRWITMHGFALNVCPDLAGFERIVPCGITDKPVGTLAEFIPEIDLNQVRQDVAAAFAEVFEVQLMEKSYEL
ncbi:MAG: lipoyl(octanoyl) transferase LipB [Aphanothece sp. CMT-3BRIN-NPC111]|jgi:lipoyl(octanoyl) transferase|nr:lipoyl(octanoyl) transferase LipB [Aphanothece sp. CMT-3BRIN-NPC111]